MNLKSFFNVYKFDKKFKPDCDDNFEGFFMNDNCKINSLKNNNTHYKICCDKSTSFHLGIDSMPKTFMTERNSFHKRQNLILKPINTNEFLEKSVEDGNERRKTGNNKNKSLKILLKNNRKRRANDVIGRNNLLFLNCNTMNDILNNNNFNEGEKVSKLKEKIYQLQSPRNISIYKSSDMQAYKTFKSSNN